jgi:hypothetical protein
MADPVQLKGKEAQRDDYRSFLVLRKSGREGDDEVMRG